MKYIGKPALPWLLVQLIAISIGAVIFGALWLVTIGAFKGGEALGDWAEFWQRLEYRYKRAASKESGNGNG